ncbi:hypothetical protein WMZ97_21655 [Lentibacillus sp. N15]|uniref:vWA domain-containing protein n=1 Tax=Lentibacillus songyuanensis TaxID=3136161 RepID=UPI0031BB32E0
MCVIKNYISIIRRRIKMFKSLRKKAKETSVLNTDSYDKRRFQQIYDMSKGLQTLEKVEEIPLFNDLLGDIWAALYKMNPELKSEKEIDEHLQINKQLIAHMIKEESYQTYHETTRLDHLLSAIGTIKFGEQVHHWLVEQGNENQAFQKQMEKVKQLEQKLNLAQQQNISNNDEQQGYNDGAGQYGNRQEESKTKYELSQAVSGLANQLNQTLAINGESFSEALSEAVSDTEDAKKGLESLFGGIKAGSGQSELQNMPLCDKIALAELISRNRKVKEIAGWAGRFVQIARAKQKMKHKESTEQSGVEVGDDLERLLPSELVQYTNPKTKHEFLRRYAEKGTLQFEKKGKETLGKGSIILCLDQSQSMLNLETQSKGFALALMSIAKKQKRNFAYIPFSSNAGREQQFLKGKIMPKEMMEFARVFLGGGTKFQFPLERSLEVIKKDRFKDADIIFVTDGEATLSSVFLNKFNTIKTKERFQVLSLLIGEDARTETVRKFSNRVINVKDFKDEGSFEAFEI